MVFLLGMIMVVDNCICSTYLGVFFFFQSNWPNSIGFFFSGFVLWIQVFEPIKV